MSYEETKKRCRIRREKARSRGPYEQQKDAVEAARMAAYIAFVLSGLAFAAQRLTPSDILAGVKDMDSLRYLYRGVCLYIYE